MTTIPKPTHDIAALIDAAHEAKQEPPRPHLGASLLGHKCDRYLWLSFRWAVVEQFKGRMLRLFRRGQLEESQVIADLRAIGVDVRLPSVGQSRVDFGCHVSGSMDGIIEGGVPGAEKTRHVLEIKTHNRKSFDALEKEGVQAAKPLHFVQMQTYMAGTRIDRALYVAVCKDDDRIYTERVHFDKDVALKAVARGHRIATSERMPDPLSTNPSWYECKFCPAYDQCHGSKTTKQVNCRTCAHSTATPDGTWHCTRWDSTIPTEHQRTGCSGHVLHPDLVPWEHVGSTPDGLNAIYRINGLDIANGDSEQPGVHSSRQLLYMAGEARA